MHLCRLEKYDAAYLEPRNQQRFRLPLNRGS
jgi:hypothetical protein